MQRKAGSCEISDRSQTTADIVASVASYYSGRFDAHGPTAQGVDWNGDASQQLRFTQLLRLVEDGSCPTIIDYGCGYGALAQRLIADGREFAYVGFDAVESMVAAASSIVRDPRCRFTSREDEIEASDFTIASGIFNVKLQAKEPEWDSYVRETIEKLSNLSIHGFAFNMLTRYADPPLMRDELYYSDPVRYFALCKECYSRNVALLHDYDLYEFTLLVRLGQLPTRMAPAGS